MVFAARFRTRQSASMMEMRRFLGSCGSAGISSSVSATPSIRLNRALPTPPRISCWRVADEELRGAVVEALTDLPDRLKLVVQLYFVEELNLAEIAQVLQVSIPRVRQLKAQALAKLRESLKGAADLV